MTFGEICDNMCMEFGVERCAKIKIGKGEEWKKVKFDEETVIRSLEEHEICK